MGCYGIHPEGLKGTGPNPYGTNYPFVLPSADVAHVFTDCYVAFRKPFSPPLSVVWLYGFDKAVNCGTVIAVTPPTLWDGYTPTHEADFLVRDGGGNDVFNSTEATVFRQETFGPRLWVYEWETKAAVGRLVQHVATPYVAAQRLLPDYIFPTSGVLHARCGSYLPPRVDRLAASTDPHGPNPNVVLAPGYNLLMTARPATAVGLRKVTTITVSAVAGAGAGRVPIDCGETTPVVTGFAGVAPDGNGNVALLAAGCQWLRQPTTAVVPSVRMTGTLALGDDCKACLDCQDVMAAQDTLLTVWQRLKNTADQAAALSCRLERLIKKWTDAKACREPGPVSVAAVVNGSLVDVVLAVCNSTDDCYWNVAVVLTVAAQTTGTSAILDARLIPNTSFATDGLGGTGPVEPVELVGPAYKVTWLKVPPRASVVYQGRFAATIPVPIADGTVTVTAVATQNPVTDPPTPPYPLGAAAATPPIPITYDWGR